MEEYFPLPERLAPSDEQLFMLEMMGESMIEAGILNGDYVIVRQQTTANNGEIVVAMTEENEATVNDSLKRKIIPSTTRKFNNGSYYSKKCGHH